MHNVYPKATQCGHNYKALMFVVSQRVTTNFLAILLLHLWQSQRPHKTPQHQFILQVYTLLGGKMRFEIVTELLHRNQ